MGRTTRLRELRMEKFENRMCGGGRSKPRRRPFGAIPVVQGIYRDSHAVWSRSSYPWRGQEFGRLKDQHNHDREAAASRIAGLIESREHERVRNVKGLAILESLCMAAGQ